MTVDGGPRAESEEIRGRRSEVRRSEVSQTDNNPRSFRLSHRQLNGLDVAGRSRRPHAPRVPRSRDHLRWSEITSKFAFFVAKFPISEPFERKLIKPGDAKARGSEGWGGLAEEDG